MKIAQLKKRSLVYAMALCCQPLLGMENQYQFPAFNSTNTNMPQLYNQNQQPQIHQQPQFPGMPQHNAYPWMNPAPQNQVIPLQSQYVMTPTGLHVINQVIHQTVYPVQQPQQYNPMPMFQNQQPPMPLGAFSGNHFIGQVGMNGMTQQAPYIPFQNQSFQPGFQNNGDNQQGTGMKRNSEHMGFNEKAEPQKRQKQEAKKLTRREMNVHKMLLMKEYMNNMSVPKELSDIITLNLHEVTHINPVLDGKLIYTPDNGEKATFNIKDLVETNGCIDLSNNIFGDTSDYFLITTDLEEFFMIDQNSDKLVMLIAPRFLIEEKIESTAYNFKPIIDSWKEDQAPIGFFWRMVYWRDLGWYDYLTYKNVTDISKNNLMHVALDAWAAGPADPIPTHPSSCLSPGHTHCHNHAKNFMFICEPK